MFSAISPLFLQYNFFISKILIIISLGDYFMAIESYKYKSQIATAAAFIAGLVVYIGQDKLATIVPTEYANWIPIIVLVAGYILAQTTENKRVDVAEQIVREEYTDPTAEEIEEDDTDVVGDDADDDGC